MPTDCRLTRCSDAPNLSNGRRRMISRASASTVLLTALLSLPCLAQTSPRGTASIRVENFGRVNDQYYRGAQPNTSQVDRSRKSLTRLDVPGRSTMVEKRNDVT